MSIPARGYRCNRLCGSFEDDVEDTCAAAAGVVLSGRVGDDLYRSNGVSGDLVQCHRGGAPIHKDLGSTFRRDTFRRYQRLQKERSS